jgi:hypothetical protein
MSAGGWKSFRLRDCFISSANECQCEAYSLKEKGSSLIEHILSFDQVDPVIATRATALLSKEAQVLRRKFTQVREDCRQEISRHAVPLRQRRAILID